MNTTPVKRPSLRELQKNMTLDVIRKAARKLFYSRAFDEVSIDDIASESGVSRGTIYLHFSSKNEIIFDLLIQDMIAQMAIYDELAEAQDIDYAVVRAWVQRFWESMHKRHPSQMHLFPLAFIYMPDQRSIVVSYREKAIEQLGRRHPGFDLEGLTGIDRERKRTRIYMMLFEIEQVAYTFSETVGTPEISIGLDVLAEELLAFCQRS